MVFDDGHVKLARQQDDTNETQKHDGKPRSTVEGSPEQRLKFDAGFSPLGKAGNAAENGIQNENADGQKGGKFHQRFGGDRQHQTMLMFGRIDMAGSKQHCEQRECERDNKRSFQNSNLWQRNWD